MTCTYCRRQIVRARIVDGKEFCNERCIQMHIYGPGPDFFGPVDNIIERPIYYTGTASNPWPKEKP